MANGTTQNKQVPDDMAIGYAFQSIKNNAQGITKATCKQ